ncbi:MAG: S24 family peptidase [Patescibacteria group bacterium]|nr:S24 family peptidase [Patescibacteria group bacterium]
MHEIQSKLMALALKTDLSQLTLRDIGERVDLGREKPQIIKHHLQQLVKRGLLRNKDGKYFRVIVREENKKSGLISLPIYGLANCGEALSIADDQVQGYLKVSPSIIKNKKKVFVVKAKGNSMNKAFIGAENIDDGDYVLIDAESKTPESGDYILSIIDGSANIKRFKEDRSREMVILLSESTSNYDPIYIHQNDLDSYSVAGKVLGVLKN